MASALTPTRYVHYPSRNSILVVLGESGGLTFPLTETVCPQQGPQVRAGPWPEKVARFQGVKEFGFGAFAGPWKWCCWQDGLFLQELPPCIALCFAFGEKSPGKTTISEYENCTCGMNDALVFERASIFSTVNRLLFYSFINK